MQHSICSSALTACPARRRRTCAVPRCALPALCLLAILQAAHAQQDPSAPRPGQPSDQPLPDSACGGCGAGGAPPGCVCRFPSTDSCFLEIDPPRQISPGRLVLEASAVVCCHNCRADLCDLGPCDPPSPPPPDVRCPVHFSVTLSVTWDLNVTGGIQFERLVKVILQGSGGFNYENSFTAPPEQSAERFDRLAEAVEHAVAAAEQFLGEHDDSRARQAVRTAERVIARMLETIGEHGDAGQAFDRCIRAIERLARLQPALDKSPSAAERLLQPAVARAVALRDAEALERCLNVVQIVGRSTTPWRPASWYLTIALSQQDDPAFRDRRTRDWLLDFCRHWLLRHNDAATLDLKYRVLVRRGGRVPTREAYEELKRFWETQRTQWISGLQALDEDPVLAQWAALRWLAFWADELGLAQDVRKWVAQARSLALRYPLRRFRQDDLFHLLWRNRQLQPDGTRRRNDPGVELARQRGRLARAPIWLMSTARRIARLALMRDVLRHWLSHTSAAGSSPAYSPRADLARAVSSYAALLDARRCPEPREPNDPCADPNNPGFDPNDCPPVIRNGWSSVVWRRWLDQPVFQAGLDADRSGQLNRRDLAVIEARLRIELQRFRSTRLQRSPAP